MTFVPPFAALQDYFDARTWGRGLAYYNAGRVGPLQVVQRRQGWDVVAAVQGQAGAPYRVGWHLASRPPDCYGECSCPVGVYCKHMVAVLLALEEWMDAPEAAPAARGAAELKLARGWLQELDSLSRQQDDRAAACLVYTLGTGLFAKGPPALTVYKSRRLKKGGLGSPTPFRGYANPDLLLRRPDFVADSDAAVLRLLQSSLSWSDAACVDLDGDWGHAAVLAALATGRCYWQRVEGEPLLAGEAWQHAAHLAAGGRRQPAPRPRGAGPGLGGAGPATAAGRRYRGRPRAPGAYAPAAPGHRRAAERAGLPARNLVRAGAAAHAPAGALATGAAGRHQAPAPAGWHHAATITDCP